MKPQIAYKISASRDAIEKVFGPKVGELFVLNPTVTEYAVVLRFPGEKVVISGELERALRKVSPASGTILVIAREMTLESRQVAHTAGCDVITKSEFGWTDAAYQAIRQR